MPASREFWQAAGPATGHRVKEDWSGVARWGACQAMALAPPAAELWEIVGDGRRRSSRLRDPIECATGRRTDRRWVFHLAAQALVPRVVRDPLGTFATNVLGRARAPGLPRATPLECIVW